ncbi:MAG: prephenate dehydrogenase/arogenate dehydrogenase family protein, partial [Gammaproteobacteria bacterium]|nr:prephenate dehydrogenase/arogenate dehydrogenase family protein [Gammaproteobacteria bacterium]
MTLERHRDRLDEIDRRILELVAERQATIGEIAKVKRSTGFPLRDFKRERDVFQKARAKAMEVGVSADVAESLMRLLIRYSLTQQEQTNIVAHAHGGGQRALVIGGMGKMGGWFAQFLFSQGYEVEVADPRAEPSETSIPDWRASDLGHDYVIVAAPLGETNVILQQLAKRKPRGIVMDLGSLKSPLRKGLKALRSAGVRTASIHPMFGPDVQLLSGRHVVFIDLGDTDALAGAQALFAPTMAEQVVTTLEKHDQLIAFVLGLSHALNIAFFTALADSGEDAAGLMRMSSTTFEAQFEIARKVAQESPALYYEIQRLNEFGGASLTALARAVAAIRDAVEQGD